MWQAGLVALCLVTIVTVSSGHPGHDGHGPQAFNLSKWLCRVFPQLPWCNKPSFSIIPLTRTIVGSCKAEVGTCPVGSCRYNYQGFFGVAFSQGYICPETKTLAVDCGVFGEHKVEVVTACECCKDKGIEVVGTVTESDSGNELSGIKIKFNGRKAGKTDANGDFKGTIPTGTTELTVHAKDKKQRFLPAVKVIDVPEGFRGPIVVDIRMVRVAAPITISDPTTDTTFSLSEDPEDDSLGVAQLVIEGNSLKDKNGNVVTGPIDISINHVDAATPDSEEDLVGRFLTNDGEQLISDGIFSIAVKDTNGDDLNGNILLKVREGMKAWNLDEETGKWVEAENLNRRRKRNVDLTDELLIAIGNGNWVNIDKIPTAPRCYFKAIVYFQDHTEAAQPGSYKPDILVFTPNGERLRLYSTPTTAPNDTCFEVRCLNYDAADPTNVLIGFINLTTYENVMVGGVSIPVVTQLEPKLKNDYIPTIQSAHDVISYEVTPNNMEIFANFISSPTGAFFTDRATCEAADDSQPTFHFTKPELPSYEPVPDDTDICTARIAFKDNYNFHEVMDELETAPTISAISTWTDTATGNDYFYTDTATIQLSNNDTGDGLYFACIKYRCSTASELTNVYLSIDAPLIEVNDTDGPFDDETQFLDGASDDTILVPAFSCSGQCQSEICYQPNSTISGTFEAPTGVSPDGPDFYDNSVNDCASRTATDQFAYEFWCYTNSFGNKPPSVVG